MSGYFAGLMRQTGIGAAAPSGLSASSPAPAPLESEATVDAAPAAGPAEPAPLPAAAEGGIAPPAAPPAPHPPHTPGVIPRPEAFHGPEAAHMSPLEVEVARAAAPPPPLVVPPSGAVERILAPAADPSGIPAAPSDPPTSDPAPWPLERTELREADANPPPPRRTELREADANPPPPFHPVRGIPSDPPRTEPAGRTGTRSMPSPAGPLETAFEVPPAPPAVHPFAEVLAEARRWVAATPVPGEPARADEAALELDAFTSAPVPPYGAAGTRPRRAAAGVAAANEEVHVSIGAITVTIEDPAGAGRPAAPAPAPRPEPDFRSRMARHYLRPE